MSPVGLLVKFDELFLQSQSFVVRSFLVFTPQGVMAIEKENEQNIFTTLSTYHITSRQKRCGYMKGSLKLRLQSNRNGKLVSTVIKGPTL